jgi:hypothetical protein
MIIDVRLLRGGEYGGGAGTTTGQALVSPQQKNLERDQEISFRRDLPSVSG